MITLHRWIKAGKIIPSRIVIGAGAPRLLSPQIEIDRVKMAENPQTLEGQGKSQNEG